MLHPAPGHNSQTERSQLVFETVKCLQNGRLHGVDMCFYFTMSYCIEIHLKITREFDQKMTQPQIKAGRRGEETLEHSMCEFRTFPGGVLTYFVLSFSQIYRINCTFSS